MEIVNSHFFKPTKYPAFPHALSISGVLRLVKSYSAASMEGL